MMSVNEISAARADEHSIGKLALQYCAVRLRLEVLKSNAGFYIGTFDDGPCSRESVEYFATKDQAERALAAGSWTQRSEP